MKDSLSGLATAYMQCVPITSPWEPKRIEAGLSSLAHAFRLRTDVTTREEDLPQSAGTYGFELRFDVRAAPDARRLISITAAFSIECGSDTMLLVFAPGEKSWRQVLRWQSPIYTEISGAFGGFEYRISPPDESGLWYVTAAHIAPWCSSNWSTIEYEALRPSAPGSKPGTLLSRSHSIWLGNDDPVEISSNPAGFEVRFHAASIDSAVHNRVFIHRYKVKGDSVTRVQPVAVSARDFVDEWIVSAWSEAEDWSAQQNLDQLQAVHQELHGQHGFDFGSVQQCAGAASEVEVEVDPPEDDVFYFRVAGQGSFTLVRAGNMPDPECR